MPNYNNIEEFQGSFQIWKSDFLKSRLYQQAIKDVFTVHDYEFEIKMHRNVIADRHITLLPFYFIDNFITNLDDGEQVIDIGCGTNFFKNFYANIHGVDPYDFGPHTRDETLNAKWYTDNYGKLRKIFSINALHHIDAKLLQHRLDQFTRLLTPDGIGYMSLNTARMTPENKFEIIEDTLSKNNFIFMLAFPREHQECPLDGNIHLVIKGKNE